MSQNREQEKAMFAKMGKNIKLTKEQVSTLDDSEIEKGLRNQEHLTSIMIKKLKDEKEKRLKQAEVDANRPSVQVNSIIFFDGENYGGDYRITFGGSVEYKDGWAGELKALGGRKLTNQEISEVAKEEGKEVDPNDEDEIYEYLNEKQDNNTYNASSAMYPDINFGFFDVGDKQFMSFKQHSGSGDIRGNYGENELFEISKVDTGFTGEPKGDLVPFMYPEIEVSATIGDRKVSWRDDGGMHGASEFFDNDNNKQISEEEFGKITKDLKTFDIDEAREKYANEHKEFS